MSTLALILMIASILSLVMLFVRVLRVFWPILLVAVAVVLILQVMSDPMYYSQQLTDWLNSTIK
jgi:H+/gluconate symporter-like permease